MRERTTNKPYRQPLKLWKVNIGSEKRPKLTFVRYYWDEQTMSKIKALLKEYKDVFPQIFIEVKGIKGQLGEMKIELWLYAKLVKHQLYRLNPKVKEKAKDIDRLLAIELIFLMDEFDWINPIVIYNKKDIDDVRVCVDFNTLNSKCIHNPFPTPFSDEVLNQVS